MIVTLPIFCSPTLSNRSVKLTISPGFASLLSAILHSRRHGLPNVS